MKREDSCFLPSAAQTAFFFPVKRFHSPHLPTHATAIPYLESDFGVGGGSFHDCAALIIMMCHCSLLLSPFFPLWPNRQNINHFDLFGDMSTPPSVRAATQMQNIHEPKLMEADKIAKIGCFKLIYFKQKRPEHPKLQTVLQ